MKNTFASFFGRTAVFVCCVSVAGVLPCSLHAQQRMSSGAARYAEELTASLSRQVRAVQDENAALETRVIELERKIAALQETNQKLLNEVAAVKRQSAADADAREAQMKTILSRIDKLAATPAPVTVPTPVSTEADYEIYEVQKGETLSVIATAYGVTVQDIKKANNLKSDMLQIGQKLKIPKK